MRLIGRGGEGSATESLVLDVLAAFDLCRRYVAHLGVETLELKLPRLLFEPETSKLAYLGAALELLLRTPVA